MNKNTTKYFRSRVDFWWDVADLAELIGDVETTMKACRMAALAMSNLKDRHCRKCD